MFESQVGVARTEAVRVGFGATTGPSMQSNVRTVSILIV